MLIFENRLFDKGKELVETVDGKQESIVNSRISNFLRCAKFSESTHESIEEIRKNLREQLKLAIDLNKELTKSSIKNLKFRFKKSEIVLTLYSLLKNSSVTTRYLIFRGFDLDLIEAAEILLHKNNRIPFALSVSINPYSEDLYLNNLEYFS